MSNATTPAQVRVIDSRGYCPTVDIVPSGGSAIAVVWPGTGALHRTFQVIKLDPGAATRDLVHQSDSVYYVMRGTGAVEDAANNTATELREGSMIHIDAGDLYRLRGGPEGIDILGGPCPADMSWYKDIEGAMP